MNILKIRILYLYSKRSIDQNFWSKRLFMKLKKIKTLFSFFQFIVFCLFWTFATFNIDKYMLVSLSKTNFLIYNTQCLHFVFVDTSDYCVGSLSLLKYMIENWSKINWSNSIYCIYSRLLLEIQWKCQQSK